MTRKRLFVATMLICAVAFASTSRGMHIAASFIDSTPIGQTTPSTVNATGYQYNGAAPVNHTLCGNGTNYVDCTGAGTTTMSIVTGSRSFGTVYQNTSGYRMTVSASLALTGGVGQGVDVYGNVASASASLPGSGATAGATVSSNSVTNSAGQAGVTFIVPPGYYYNVTWDNDGGGSPFISYWTEWVN